MSASSGKARAKAPAAAKDYEQLYLQERDERRKDDDYFSSTKAAVMQDYDEKDKKLMAENAKLKEELGKQGVVLVQDNAKVIQLEAALKLASKERDETKHELERMKKELSDTGKVLDGARRFYKAEDRINNMDYQITTLENDCGRFQDENDELKKENAALRENLHEMHNWKENCAKHVKSLEEITGKCLKGCASNLKKHAADWFKAKKILECVEKGAIYFPKSLGGTGRASAYEKFLRSGKAKALAVGRVDKKTRLARLKEETRARMELFGAPEENDSSSSSSEGGPAAP